MKRKEKPKELLMLKQVNPSGEKNGFSVHINDAHVL